MRDRMERLVGFPFSAGCISHSSVAVVSFEQQQQPRRSSKAALHDTTKLSRAREDDQDSLSSGESMTKSSRPNISTGFLRLFKSISHLFEYKDEMEDEVEMEIEIGFPTDVKHVTHIGFDDGGATNPIKSCWDSLGQHHEANAFVSPSPFHG